MAYENYGIPTLTDRPGCIGARVTAVHRERFEIITEYGFSHARMKRGLRLAADEMPTVGDRIVVQYNPAGDSVALEVLPRTALFARLDGMHGRAQLVAANMDLVCIVTSLNAEFNLRRLERYLALARESGARPVFLLTKRDLADELTVEAVVAQVMGLAPDCPVLPLSAHTGQGMDALAGLLQPGVTAVLLGSSGVGKSSLVNALSGEERMAVNGIREDDAKGRHTTVHRQLLELSSGALLIDTPGMRELGMWDAVEGVDETFSDIAALTEQCRFRDCSHRHEPGCAILAALEDGSLDPARLQSYLALRGQASRTEMLSAKRMKMIAIAKANKARRRE